MKITKSFFVMFLSFIIAACSGGGSSAPAPVTPGGGGGISGTAAQYFTKLAVGNSWTWAESNGSTTSGKITDLSGGKITTISQPNNIKTTALLDATGALVTTSYFEPTPGYLITTAAVSLPAIFSVGTTWTIKPATATESAVKGTIVAFNVTRSVLAGTFTDCLQVDQSYTVANGTANPTIVSATSYLSPTAGVDVYTEGKVGSNTFSHQLIAGYTANSVLSVTSVSPGSGPVGSVVAINGVNFSATLASNTVRFNGIQATITSATTTQLMVTVPASATSGKITVTVGGNTATSAVDYTVTTPGGSGSGTAAQYFSKNAVGNTWKTLQTDTVTPTGSASIVVTSTDTLAVTASTGGVVTFSEAYTTGTPPVTTNSTFTGRIDTAGAWVVNDGTSSYVALPPNFSVGTSWVAFQASVSSGAVNRQVVAFNVTRTVPAGTFTDCLRIDSTQTNPDGSTFNESYYISPTVGNIVDVAGTYSYVGGAGISSRQLQAGYIANP